jgi:hypothetical protein
MLVFVPEPWTAFVLHPLLRFFPKAMNTSRAICRMREVIWRQPKALSTEDGCIGWLRRHVRALREMPEGLSSEKKLEKFLTDLPVNGKVAASTQNQAFRVVEGLRLRVESYRTSSDFLRPLSIRLCFSAAS